MQGLFSRPFVNLDSNDLRDLVEVRKVREHVNLDYKRDPYGHNHEGAVEMLADVTAMANARGGYILIGVEEDDTEPDGTPGGLVGIENGDAEATWVQNVCLTSIDERIPGLRVRDIPLANERSCVIIQIPNSVKKPHMVVHERHRSFRIRHGRSKSFMEMQEVRSMIISMNAYRVSLADFLNERKEALRAAAKGAPWLLLMATPIYVDTEKIDPLRKDLRNILQNPPVPLDGTYGGIFSGKPKPRLFGIEATYPQTQVPQTYKKALRLFRNGHLEYCEDYSKTIPADWPNEEMILNSYKTTVIVIQFLETAKQVMQLGEVNEPIAVTAHWENFNPSSLHGWERDLTPACSRDDILIWRDQSLTIDFAVNELSNPSAIARSVVGRLFNAFGLEDNPHFEPDGNFIKRR